MMQGDPAPPKILFILPAQPIMHILFLYLKFVIALQLHTNCDSAVKDRKRETFIFKGLGFPIKLVNVPMRKMVGEWVLDIDFEKLELAVLHGLLEKPVPLNGDELKFIRKYLDLSTTAFGKIFGVSHVAVIKWEKGTRANLSTDVCIRLYMYDHLKKTKDKDFRNFYQKIKLEKLAKSANEKVGPIIIESFEELKST